MVSQSPITTRNTWMRNVMLIAIVTAVGGFLFGFDNGSISGSVGFLQSKFALDADGIGWVTSSIIVGCIIGVALAGPLSDAVGRKKVLLLTALIFIIGTLGGSNGNVGGNAGLVPHHCGYRHWRRDNYRAPLYC